MSRSGWEALPGVREWLEVSPVSSGGPAGCPEVVGRPSGMSESGLEAVQDVREWS